jgi:putative nucleotidyltransferase with HDIG domain
MKVGRTIYSGDGRVLLTAGMILNDYYIERLHTIGIASIYIKEELFDGVEELPDVISEQSRAETIKLVKDSFTSLEQHRRINIRAVRQTVDNIIDELLSNRELLINLSDIRSYDDYTFSHSVNVCILSLMTAITLGFHELKLKELGIGALLHDIGKIRIDKEILNKPGELSTEEMSEVKRHSEYGFEILRAYDDVPLLSAHIAFQHHERWDGNGYPRGLRGEDIHEYARIVAVADVYDALLADRPYRPSYSVDQAVTVVSRMSDIYFEPRSLAALVSHIAIFPVGSVVMLSSGQVGLVVDVNKDAPTRPVVRILFDTYGKRIPTPHEIDLTRLTTVYVNRVLSENDILELINTSGERRA